MITIPRIVIAGTHSGVGKTTVATALMAALVRRGLAVQPFKVGPDFIDPGFHAAACGRVSRNLDGWMLSRGANLSVFARALWGRPPGLPDHQHALSARGQAGTPTPQADLAVVEGVMGLFDGRGGTSEEGSTAEMAKWLRAPVVLVADASAMARSAAAVVHGFESFDGELDVAGLLFNRVGIGRHVELLRQACAGRCSAQTLGFLPANDRIAMESRHLGLKLASESIDAGRLDAMASWIEAHVDLDGLLRMAQERSRAIETPAEAPVRRTPRTRIAVARDAAFCFYYQDNLDLLAACGAELVEFSPVSDAELPADIGGVYLGGGYPELRAAELAENRGMLEAIRSFVAGGGAVYAECGGFMYLTEAIVDLEGREHTMAGIFPTRARMQARLAALAYVEAEGGLRGHEFRYSEIDPMPTSIERYGRGYRLGSVVAGYMHAHFLSRPEFAEEFVSRSAGVAA
jgi:cobyrinic acid a,c-diamide synthase